MPVSQRRIWVYSQPDEETCRHIAEKFSLHPAVAAVLYNRGIRTESRVQTFLQGGLDSLHDPFLLQDMDRAVSRILDAAARDERVAIYGDFDVDGLTSMHVLGRFLSSLGIECTQYVPNRLAEGYGLSPEGIAKCHARGATLLVTVDCGISSVEEVAYATSRGMDAIVVDHHEPERVLPHCCAVIDPKRETCPYPFPQLAGVGVVYKLCQAILQRLTASPRAPQRRPTDPGAKRPREQAAGFAPSSQSPDPHSLLPRMIDMVALGTVADLAPLVDENRLLVKAGLCKLETTDNLGLRELKAVCNVDRAVSAYDIAFRIAPRLNAAGRMGNAESALRLLNSEDELEAYNLAFVMEENNRTRQKIEQKILLEAEEQIRRELNLSESRCVVVRSPDWHPGVTGIVASRLTKTYYRPAIIVSVDGQLGRGTGRSIPEFDLLDGLRHCRHLLSTFGGHRLAAGFEIEMANFPAFKERFEQLTAEKLSSADVTPKIFVDAVIDSGEISPRLVNSLEILEPFGEANRQPVFVSKGLVLTRLPTVVANRHLKMLIKGRNMPLEAIGFDMAHRLNEVRDTARPFDFAYILRINSYRGVETLQLTLRDFQPSETQPAPA
jgi:single-stranded-DNA-specific exonuclease